jgi:hypothetical protein
MQRISLVERRIPDAILCVERDAVPARGLANRSRADPGKGWRHVFPDSY